MKYCNTRNTTTNDKRKAGYGPAFLFIVEQSSMSIGFVLVDVDELHVEDEVAVRQEFVGLLG